MHKIKTLVVGYGLSAKAFHLPFLVVNPQFEVCGIVQPRGSSAQVEWPHVQHYTSLDEAIDKSGAALVIIAAPNEFHAPMAKQALQAGKHVVIEKPFALSVAEALELCQFAAETGKVLSVYHNRRWDADFLSLRQIIKEERVGRPVMFLSRFDRFRPSIKKGWKEEQRPGAGIFYDLAPHLLDQALQLFGTPDEVYAHIRTERREGLTPDAFDVFLYYPSLTAQLSASSLMSASWPRFSLLGTAGSYTKGGMDPQEVLLRQGILPDKADWGFEPMSAWGSLTTLSERGNTASEQYPSQPGNYMRFYTMLAEAIMKGGINPVPPQEALQVMVLMELAAESNRQGRRLPFNEGRSRDA